MHLSSFINSANMLFNLLKSPFAPKEEREIYDGGVNKGRSRARYYEL